MQSIQVSKGVASVKNGYESITGQINIEYLKPQNTQGVRGNLYLDSKWRQEGNADATQVWGPTDGVMAYIGLRFHFND